MASPYDGVPDHEWIQVTHQLINSHPLTTDLILEAALISWRRLWSTSVGDREIGFPLADINPPATVIGYMFEKLFSKELAVRLPGAWRGGQGSEKDLYCMSNPSMSVEMKASGQLGYKVFGNRSYGQILSNADAAKKDKSGYYITVNFFGNVLTLLRFGWIDSHDWRAQSSATGQMAGLPDNVYQGKLVTIPGAYILDGPVQLVNKVGAQAAERLNYHGIHSIRDLLRANSLPPALAKHQQSAIFQYNNLIS